ncbi:class I SAM-dependent methyltransferase [Chitinophaga silvatica]|uniref:Class I SAM-dependent methyltransferase n=1 Tax=Chitinophaga silvatica TaxID=2282649 RepID=A0A3E1Y3L6_9BACT|nr:class I SAM-dependent methyltransferase [Chitinophaga silvatica]RFS19290.1 class I SAM-dependent methyltransferase [Chitinophaga silvatica]
MDYTNQAVALFDKHATAYENKFMDVSLYKDSLDLLCANLTSPQASILEIACGPGNITKYLLQQSPDYKITATDLAPKMIELARQNNPSAKCEIMDGRDISTMPGSYDAIVCGFGLPYFSKENTIQFIIDSSLKLTKGGILYISTMEGDYLESGIQKSSSGDELYIYYHQEDYLVQTLLANGFTVIDNRKKLSTMTNGVKVVDLIIVAKKG